MKINLKRILGSASLVSILFSACIKDDTVELTNQGSTFIKILEAPSRTFFFSPFSDARAVDVFSIRKDVPSNEALNTPTAVKVTLTPDYIERYNDEHGTNFELLPDSLFTTTVPNSGNIYDLSLAAGQDSKEFGIQLNGGKWNFEHKYALAFYISDAGGNKLSADKDTVIAFFSVKNKYDGVYKLKLKTTGWAAYAISDGVTAEYPDEYLLITNGTNSLSGSATYRGDFLLPAIDATGAATAFGATTPLFVFDTDTDKLIDVRNTTPDDGRGRFLLMNPDVTDSRYDSDTKTIYAAFIMKQNGRPNQYFYDTLSYVGPRN